METIKCEMCTAVLQVEPGQEIVTCEYCGTSKILVKPEQIAVFMPGAAADIDTNAMTDAMIEEFNANKYKTAEDLLEAGKYTSAYTIFWQLGEHANYHDAKQRAIEIEPIVKKIRKKRRRIFLSIVAIIVFAIIAVQVNDRRAQAARQAEIAYQLETMQDQAAQFEGIFAVSRYATSSFGHAVGILPDRTVIAGGDNSDGQLDVEDWYDIIAVSAETSLTIGLRADGTVVSAGFRPLLGDQWYNIVAISSGRRHTVGLRADGTVVADGDNANGQTDVGDWRNVIAVSAGDGFTVGLLSNGTVIAAGKSEFRLNRMLQWEDIVAIVAGGSGETIGQLRDGTVVTTGTTEIRPTWRFASISASSSHVVGLSVHGHFYIQGSIAARHSLDVMGWRDKEEDIVKVIAGNGLTIGITSEGTLVSVGSIRDVDFDDWQLYVPAR